MQINRNTVAKALIVATLLVGAGGATAKGNGGVRRGQGSSGEIQKAGTLHGGGTGGTATGLTGGGFGTQ